MTLTEILKQNQLSVTDSRKKILTMFLNGKGAISHGDIERFSGEKFDRVTIYRTLQTFVEKGIIHTIPSNDNSVRYALCKDNCSEGQHHDNHIHFVCTKCGITECLSHVRIPNVELPAGYQAKQADLIVTGICKSCS